MMLRIVFFSLMVGLAPATLAAEGAMTVLQGTIDGIIALLRDPGLDPQVRRDRIVERIDRRFDFRLMSQGALSVNWRKANDQERAQFVERFSTLIKNTYLGRIEAYTDERVEYLAETIDGEKAEVETAIVTGDTRIPIRYKLRHDGDTWRIYDVVIEEVSLIRNYRDTYREIVKKDGLDGLLRQMDEKIAALARTDVLP